VVDSGWRLAGMLAGYLGLRFSCVVDRAPLVGFSSDGDSAHRDQRQHAPINDPNRRHRLKRSYGMLPEVVRMSGVYTSGGGGGFFFFVLATGKQPSSSTSHDPACWRFVQATVGVNFPAEIGFEIAPAPATLLSMQDPIPHGRRWQPACLSLPLAFRYEH